jgi:chondroitin AC lyase
VKSFLSLAVGLLFVSSLHASPSSDGTAKNIIDYYSAAGADRTSPRMQSALDTLASQARAATAPGLLLANGSFSDVDYKDVPDGGWSPWAHTQRLFTMAKAYRTPGQPFYGDPQLRAQIESALAFVPSYYGVTTIPNGNWWFWSLGVPLDLAPTLVLMRGDINAKVMSDCITTLAFHIGPNAFAKALVGPTPTGENLVWSSFTHLCLGVLKDDPTMLATVRDAMASVCATTAGDGIQIDSSFHQHGAQLYTGGYGGSFANDVSKYALLTRGTDYALPVTALDAFADYMADGVSWSLYGNYFDVSAIGREVARPTTTGYNGIAALLQSSQFPSSRQNEIRAASAKMLQSWQWSLAPELAAIAAQSSSTPVAPSGHQHYWTSDYTVHRRPGWFASVKMFSSRTKSGENTNGENSRGSRQSDGRFYLTLDGSEFFGREIWPAYDWTRLPGITVEQKADTANNLYAVGTRSFAGGATDGRNGVSAMDVQPVGSQLTAKKSWFFFDDSIVFLTNSITLPAANRVETIVQQWPLANPSSPLLRGTNWLWSENVGYYIYPQNAPLNVTREPHSGTWQSLGASDDTTPKSATFLTMWLDHGTAPVNADAAYAIVPNTTSSAMSSWIAPSIVANNATASAVRNGSTLGIVFWSAGSVAGYQSTLPCIVYAVSNGHTIDIYASDPTNGSGTYQLTVPSLVAGVRATTLTLPRNGGKTVHGTIVPPVVRRRASR